MNTDETDVLIGITGPKVIPQTDPDKLTEQEIKKAKKHSDRPSPGDRHAESVQRHIDDISRDRDRLLISNESFCRELDDLRPRYSAIQESYRASLASSVFATAMVGLGGSLISGAGYAGDGWKVVVLCFGIATFGWGFLLQITSTWLAVVFRPSPINRVDRQHRPALNTTEMSSPPIVTNQSEQ
jgi:hypothetical protein